jgi:hypothetical protein
VIRCACGRETRVTFGKRPICATCRRYEKIILAKAQTEAQRRQIFLKWQAVSNAR